MTRSTTQLSTPATVLLIYLPDVHTKIFTKFGENIYLLRGKKHDIAVTKLLLLETSIYKT